MNSILKLISQLPNPVGLNSVAVDFSIKVSSKLSDYNLSAPSAEENLLFPVTTYRTLASVIDPNAVF
jgi:hypothetical protein